MTLFSQSAVNSSRITVASNSAWAHFKISVRCRAQTSFSDRPANSKRSISLKLASLIAIPNEYLRASPAIVESLCPDADQAQASSKITDRLGRKAEAIVASVFIRQFHRRESPIEVFKSSFQFFRTNFAMLNIQGIIEPWSRAVRKCAEKMQLDGFDQAIAHSVKACNEAGKGLFGYYGAHTQS